MSFSRVVQQHYFRIGDTRTPGNFALGIGAKFNYGTFMTASQFQQHLRSTNAVIQVAACNQCVESTGQNGASQLFYCGLALTACDCNHQSRAATAIHMTKPAECL